MLGACIQSAVDSISLASKNWDFQGVVWETKGRSMWLTGMSMAKLEFVAMMSVCYLPKYITGMFKMNGPLGQ